MKNILEARPPIFPPNVFESAHDRRCHEVAVLRIDVLQEIEGDGIFLIRRGKIDNIIETPRRDVLQKIYSQITVGVDKPDPFSGFDILDQQIPQQRALACAALPDDIQMLPSINTRKDRRALSAPDGFDTDLHCGIWVHVAEANPSPVELRSLNGSEEMFLAATSVRTCDGRQCAMNGRQTL
jgi:hypothetical protein